jgi:hypothetical protein
LLICDESQHSVFAESKLDREVSTRFCVQKDKFDGDQLYT